RLETLDAGDVLQLVIEGNANGAAHRELEAALGRAEARVRALRVEQGALSLDPDKEDMASLGSSPCLIDAVSRLQALQRDPGQGEVAREALRLLVRLQGETLASAREAR